MFDSIVFNKNVFTIFFLFGTNTKYFLNKIKYKKQVKYSPKYLYNSNQFLYNYLGENKKAFFSNQENILNLKKFELFFYNFILKGNNFLFFDSNYKSTFNIYQSIYSVNNLTKNKNYFFIKPKFFTFKNWVFYFYLFCNKNNINLIVISDFKKYSRFSNEFDRSKFIFLLFQPQNIYKIESDFYFYINNSSFIFQKLFYVLYINNIFYQALNGLNESKKINFLANLNRVYSIK